MHPDWGSVPDWLSGCGTLLALFFAAFATRAAWDASKLQAEQLRKLEIAEARRAEVEERDQASTVAAWIRLTQDATPAVMCLNGSRLPIYDLVLVPTLSGTDLASGESTYAFKGPGNSASTLGHATKLFMAAVSGVLAEKGEVVSWADLYGVGALGVSVTFTDAKGLRWRRCANGKLDRL